MIIKKIHTVLLLCFAACSVPPKHPTEKPFVAEQIDLRPLDSLRQAEQQRNDSLAQIPCEPEEVSLQEFWEKLAKDSLIASPILELIPAQKKKAWSYRNKGFMKIKRYWNNNESSENLLLYVSLDKFSCSFQLNQPDEYSRVLTVIKMKNNIFLVSTEGYIYREDYTTGVKIYFICWDKLTNKLMFYPRPPRFYVRDVQPKKQFGNTFKDTFPNSIWNAEITEGYSPINTTKDSIFLAVQFGEVHNELKEAVCKTSYKERDFFNTPTLQYLYKLEKNIYTEKIITIKR